MAGAAHRPPEQQRYGQRALPFPARASGEKNLRPAQGLLFPGAAAAARASCLRFRSRYREQQHQDGTEHRGMPSPFAATTSGQYCRKEHGSEDRNAAKCCRTFRVRRWLRWMCRWFRRVVLLVLALCFARLFQHPFRCGQKFLICDVFHDLRITDANRKDEPSHAQAVLFVAPRRFQQFICAGFERWQRAIQMNGPVHAQCLFRRNGSARPGHMQRRNHAPGNGFAVQQLFVSCDSLDRMSNRMAKVQNHAQTRLALIYAYHIGLHADGGGNHVLEGLCLPAKNGVDIPLHKFKELLITNDARFDALEESGAQLAVRQGLQQVNVRKDCERVVKAADKVFACCKIHPRLSAHRRIYLSQQGRWNLNIVNAAHVDGSEKSAEVTDNAAAEGNQQRAAVCACGRKLSRQPLYLRHPLVLLSRRQKQHDWLFILWERCKKALRPQPPYLRRGQDKDAFLLWQFLI